MAAFVVVPGGGVGGTGGFELFLARDGLGKPEAAPPSFRWLTSRSCNFFFRPTFDRPSDSQAVLSSDTLITSMCSFETVWSH